MRLQIVTFTLLQALAIAGPIDKVGNKGLTATGDGLQSVTGGVNVGEPICALGRGLVATSSKATEGQAKGANHLGDDSVEYKLDRSKSREERYWDAVEELAKFCEIHDIKYGFAKRTAKALKIVQRPKSTNTQLLDTAMLPSKPRSNSQTAKTRKIKDPLGKITIMVESGVVLLTTFIHKDCHWVFKMDFEHGVPVIEYQVHIDIDAYDWEKDQKEKKVTVPLFSVSVVHTRQLLDSDTVLKKIPGRPGVQVKVCKEGKTFIELPPPQPPM